MHHRHSLSLAILSVGFASSAGAASVVDTRRYNLEGINTGPLNATMITHGFTLTAAASPGKTASPLDTRKFDDGAGPGIGTFASDGVSGDEAKIGGGTGDGTDSVLQATKVDDAGTINAAGATLGGTTEAGNPIDSR